MELRQAFPIAIIDEDYDDKSAAGRGMRQLAAAIEKQGFRIVAGLSYEDARRLVNVFNTESCWLVSVDGREDDSGDGRYLRKCWPQSAGAMIACRSFCSATSSLRRWCRQACSNMPMRSCGCSKIRLSSSPASSAAPRSSISSACPADVQGAHGLHFACQLFLAHARSRRRCRLPEEPGRTAILSVLWREHPALRRLGFGGRCSDRCSITPARLPQASAMRRGFSVPMRPCLSSAVPRPPTRSSGMALLSRGDLVLCDRNCHKSILHSLIMTGATPDLSRPSRNGLGIIGPISREQFTPESIRKKIAASPFGKETKRQGSPHGDDQLNLRRSVLQYRRRSSRPLAMPSMCCTSTKRGTRTPISTSSTTAITPSHPNDPARSPQAITFATHSTHKLLAALSQASMIHVQHA